MMTSSSCRGGPGGHKDPTDDPDHVWSLLSNYAHVLVCVARDRDLTLRQIADRVGITERATHRLVSQLESAGVITRQRAGRRNHYEIEVSMPLRHPLEEDRTVGDLLTALFERSDAAALGLRSRPRGESST